MVARLRWAGAHNNFILLIVAKWQPIEFIFGKGVTLDRPHIVLDQHPTPVI